MTRNAVYAIAIAVAIFHTPLAAQTTGNTLSQEDPAAVAESATETTSWGVTCDHDVTGKRTGCRLTQTVVDRSSGKRLITVTLHRTPGEEPPALLVTLPLRTFLVPGALVQVDQRPGWQLPFEHCDESGCYAARPLDKDSLGLMNSGESLSVAYFDEKRRKTEIKLPLKTFSQQYEKAGERLR